MMTGQIKNSFVRLKSNKLIFALLIASLAIPVLRMLGLYTEYQYFMLQGYDTFQYASKNDPRSMYQVLTFILAVFTYLFISEDKFEGGFRNKITCGVRRSSIYLSELIVTAFFAELYTACFVFSWIITFKISGKFGTRLFYSVPFKSYVIFFLWSMAFAALFTLVNVYFSNRIFAVLLSLVMLTAFNNIGSFIEGRLNAPYKEKVVSEETGEEYWRENPHYISGKPRQVLTRIAERTPEKGLSEKTTDHVIRTQAQATIFLFILSGSAGIISFQRKDLV